MCHSPSVFAFSSTCLIYAVKARSRFATSLVKRFGVLMRAYNGWFTLIIVVHNGSVTLTIVVSNMGGD
jgi:hypothetical protein